MYGIIVGKIFCGESMFSLKKNSSKIALAYLAAYLKEGGFKYIDTQFIQNILNSLELKRLKEKIFKYSFKIWKNNADFPKK